MVHNVDELLNLGSINEIKGNELSYYDIWIGGFPCQDISCAGKMKGFVFKDPAIGEMCHIIATGVSISVFLILFVLPSILIVIDRVIYKKKTTS